MQLTLIVIFGWKGVAKQPAERLTRRHLPQQYQAALPVSRYFYPTLHYHIQILNEPIKTSVYCSEIQRYQVTNLIWLRYHMLICFFGTVKTYGQHFGTLRTHSRLVDLESWHEHVNWYTAAVQGVRK